MIISSWVYVVFPRNKDVTPSLLLYVDDRHDDDSRSYKLDFTNEF